MRLHANISYIREQLKDTYPPGETDGIVRHIFAALKGFSPTDLLLKGDYELSDKEAAMVESIIARLKNHEPVQYILGETLFFGFPFRVTKDVLIPRPETEELVEWILASTPTSDPARILDIGTGSGCMAVSLKKLLPETGVYACDISEEALTLARTNAAMNSAGVFFFQLDILSPPTPSCLPQFDIIASNPPYVTLREREHMCANVLNFEPFGALFVPDDDPLKFYKAIALFCKSHLREKGMLYFEINEAYGNECRTLLEKHGFTRIELRNDINNKPRFLRAQKQKTEI